MNSVGGVGVKEISRHLFPPWIRLPTSVPSEMWRRLRKRFLSKKVKQQERPRQRHFQMRPDKKNISTMFSGEKIKALDA